MRHDTVHFYLEGFAREELGSAQNARIDRHLAECEPCAAYSAQITPLNALLANAATSLPAGFDAALEAVRQKTLRTVRQEAQADRPMGLVAAWFGHVGRWSVAAPIALAAALLVFLVLSPSRKETATTTPVASLTPVASPSDEPAASDEPAVAPDVSAPTAAHPDMAPSGAIAEQAASRNFVVLRKGQDVQIEWLRNGHPHHVRKSDNPAALAVASAQTVQGPQWSDSGRTAPGSVTYYLID